MVQAVHAGKRAASPLALLAVSDSPADKLRCAQTVMRDKSDPPRLSLYSREPYCHERIRVGYLSADFRTHPVSMLMAGVFEGHDRARFDPIAFSYGVDDASPLRARVKNSFSHFHDVRDVSDNDIALLIAESEIDILVDLTGLTASARPGVLALRPAPVQVNYLGFAGTMGAAFMDYIIADRIVIPETQQDFYTEKVAYLPHCYLPHDKARRVGTKKPSRTQAGLPERGFIFASFNNSYKFSPAMFEVWMRLLNAVDGSVLWLSEVNAAATRNLRREAQARGVDPARLVFAPRLPAAEDHLARVGLAELFLDTLPYNAHTTAMDALWAGLPVLTLMGESFAGRVAASLLQAANLPELITTSLQAYEDKALALARDPRDLSKLKAKLEANHIGGPLFDTERFTRNLEAAYRMMWLRRENGQAAENLYIEEAASP
jgi:predicted O-linked N-acetylglucosamine transferase (SPINDLY family)